MKMANCCSAKNIAAAPSVTTKKRFVVIGGGSAAFAAAIQAHTLGAAVTMINEGLPIGGCCVNVGCVPSKTLIRAAEAHHRANSKNHQFHGIDSNSRITDFDAIIQQKTELVQTLRQQKYVDVIKDFKDTELIHGWASLIDPSTVEVNGRHIPADRILIATGDTTFVPDVPGLKNSPYLTTDSAFELTALPKTLIVLGGRYVALECAQLFARLGSKVTVLQRSDRILPTEDSDLTNTLTNFLVDNEGIDVQTGVKLLKVSHKNDMFSIDTVVHSHTQTFEAEQLLVATGRTPNTSNMGLVERAGVAIDEKGFIKVDSTLQTNVPTIFAAGNVIGEPAYVYTAAYEGTLAASNALSTGEFEKRDYAALPWVVFTDPQVAGVGLNLQQAKDQGIDAEASKMPLSHVPRALAARDTRGFIELIRDKATDAIVGGRILAPEGGELVMEISMAIKYGVTAKQLSNSFHPYLTLSEGIKLAAISFGKDINKLSCCAS